MRKRNAATERREVKMRAGRVKKSLTPQLMVCYLLGRHYALSQVWVS